MRPTDVTFDRVVVAVEIVDDKVVVAVVVLVLSILFRQ